MIREVKDFVKYLSDKKQDYSTGSLSKKNFGFKYVKSISFPYGREILDKLKSCEKEIELDEEETDYLNDIVPDDFSDYIHFRGKFFFVDYSTGTVSKVEKSSIDDVKIFDLSRFSEVETLKSSIRAALDILESSIDRYDEGVIYDELNYSIEKERMIPNETYDGSLSITRGQSKAMNEWQTEHNKKYHKKGFGYRGASPTSNFEIVIGSNSIGTYADCRCTSCLEAAENAREVGDNKASEKIRKRAFFEVFNNM